MIPTSFIDLPAQDTPKDREMRQRAAEATKLFGGSARVSGRGLDFSQPSAGTVRPSGMASTLDLYGEVVPHAAAQRAEAERRLDAIPADIRELSRRGLDLSDLEAVVVLRRDYRAGGEQPIPVQRGALGRAIGVSADRAEAIIDRLTQAGVLRRHATAGTVPYFRLIV
ncbi:hypothetical protein [Salinarimonas rosea]|uniref:hypothetical protein n=1 Tax=Salinarimonas rosea TaxID=552063 RepID=UPI000425872E|nr:hypothetical protein [Salinarimonas rosea]